MEGRQIADHPVGPEEDVGGHRFDPTSDIRTEDVFVIARCACGWEGDAFPESDQGYEEAEIEWRNHTVGLRHESVQPLDQ